MERRPSRTRHERRITGTQCLRHELFHELNASPMGLGFIANIGGTPEPLDATLPILNMQRIAWQLLPGLLIVTVVLSTLIAVFEATSAWRNNKSR